MVSLSPLAAGFCQGVSPPPEQPLREWVCENVYLPNSPEGARYSLEAVPAHATIWDWLEDPGVKEIAIIACVGFGKTAIIEGLCARVVAVEQGDTLMVGQTGDMVKDWMEGRMRKVWQTSPATAPHVPTGPLRHNWKKDSVIFAGMNFYAGAANITDLQEKSMVNTIGDEVWRWDDGMIDFLLKRHHGRWNRRNLMLSQGGNEDGQWHRFAKDGKWHELEHVCPSCSMGSVFDWDNFKYEVIKDGNEEFDWSAIFETVRLRCPHCGEDFQDTEYNRRQWAKCRPFYDEGKHIPERMTLRATFMTVWRYQWRDIVKEWILANEDKRNGSFEKLQNVINQRFAQFWKEPTDTPTLEYSGDPYSKKAYHDGQKWELEDFRFLTVDVQQGHFWAVIRACKIGGESRMLWEGRLETWDNVFHLQDRYDIENRFVYVDCGYNQEAVAKKAREASMRKKEDPNPWKLLKGEDSKGYLKIIKDRKFMRIFSDYTHIKSSEGWNYKIIRFSNLLAKDKLSHIMGSGNFGIPTDVSKTYHIHMQNETKREISPGVWRWQPVKPKAANHLWDCEVQQVVAQCITGVLQGMAEITKE